MTEAERLSVATALNRSLPIYATAAHTDASTWYRTKDNWNAIVTGAATMAALALSSEYPASAAATLDVALPGLALATGTIGASDGSWPEGQVYAQYAALSMTHALAALETAIVRQINSFTIEPKWVCIFAPL